jgi:DNA-directed RNA polymerase subunit E'/Rpb7
MKISHLNTQPPERQYQQIKNCYVDQETNEQIEKDSKLRIQVDNVTYDETSQMRIMGSMSGDLMGLQKEDEEN